MWKNLQICGREPLLEEVFESIDSYSLEQSCLKNFSIEKDYEELYNLK